MIEEITKAILDWVPIIQGMLGAILLAIITKVCIFIYSYSSEKIAHHSKKVRMSRNINTMLHYDAFHSENKDKSTSSVAFLIYRSIRHLYIGIIWLCLGLMFLSFSKIISFIGFAGCLFYMLRAFDAVKPIGLTTNMEQKREEALRELDESGVFDELDKNKNK